MLPQQQPGRAINPAPRFRQEIAAANHTSPVDIFEALGQVANQG